MYLIYSEHATDLVRMVDGCNWPHFVKLFFGEAGDNVLELIRYLERPLKTMLRQVHCSRPLLQYSGQCKGYAGTFQVPWPVPEVCKYPPGTLTGVRGMWVPSRYPDQCQGYAGILQVSWPVCVRSMQVPPRYPDQCQGCAGTLQVS